MEYSASTGKGGGVEKRAYPRLPLTVATPAATSSRNSTPVGVPTISRLAKGGRFSVALDNTFPPRRSGYPEEALLEEPGSTCRAMVPYRPGSNCSWRTCGDSLGVSNRGLLPLLALPPSPNPNFPAGTAEGGSWVSRRAAPSKREIPSEVFPIVFQYMDAATLCSVSPVSREWRKQGNDDRYWGRLCRSRFNVTPDSFAPPPDPIKRLYQLQYGSLRAMRKGCHQRYHSAPPAIPAQTSAQLLMGLMAANAM